MTTENIDIRVSEDGSRVVRRRLDDIADSADRAYASADRMVEMLKHIGKYLAVTEVMRWADAWSVASSSIKIATTNSFEFVQVQSELFKIAQRSRQELGALAELYAAVARQSENLKTSQQGLLLYTENISKALAIQHTSMQAARGPLLQLGQAMASGKIRAQEFNSIMLGLPYVMKVVAENFKGGAVSVMQLRQMMLQGKLESIEFYEAFQRGTKQINDDFEKTQITFSQAFTIFKNELIKFTGNLDSTTGAASKFATVLKFVADNLAFLASALVALSVGTKLGPLIANFIALRAESAATAAQVAAANIQMAESEVANAAAAMNSARASVTKTEAELANVRATQGAIIVSREAALATLAKANSDIAASRATIQAASSAGALSYALAVKREAELALTVAETQRSAVLAELAVLGQQQARVTVIQTEATAAHAAAVRALAVAQGTGAQSATAYAAAQSAAAVATGRVGIVAGTTAVATRLFTGAVALMGGPIGVAIAALIGLALWLSNVKSKANDARSAVEAVNRVNAAKDGGKGVRQSDAEKIQAAKELAQKELEEAEDKLQKLELNIAEKRRIGRNDVADKLDASYGVELRKNISEATSKVEKFSNALEDAKKYSVETGGAAGYAARQVSQARGAWEASIGSVKTATTIQEKYNEELETSRKSHSAYIEQLKANNKDGVNNAEIARATSLQAEAEVSMAKTRDAALKALKNKGAEEVNRVKLDADERLSVLQNAMENEVSVRKQAYETEKRILDAKHQNGVISEAQFMAKNLQMVESYENDEIRIINSSVEKYKQAYDSRRAYILSKLSGAEEKNALTQLDAEYEKFVDSANAKLSKLSTSAFERQQIAIAKLNGDIQTLDKQNAKYWREADANIDKEKAIADAKLKLAFATEEQQAAFEASLQTGAQHNAQIEKLKSAYDEARQEADDFKKSIDWETAGFETIFVLETMNDKADEFANRLSNAYSILEQLKTRSAQAAAQAVKTKEFNKTIEQIGDSIEQTLFEGGKSGGKKLHDWLKNYFVRNPIKVLIQGGLSILGGALTSNATASAGGSVGSTVGAASGISGGIANTISNAFGKFASSSVGQTLGLSNAQAIAGNNPSAYVPPGGELTATGQSLGSALGVVGNTLAGYALGSMTKSLISGGYSVSKGMNTFQNVGVAVGSAIGGPVVGAAIGAGAGLVNRVFGRKLKDSGIQGTFGGQSGFEGKSFEFYKGGWLRSNKTKTNPLGEEVRKTLGDTFVAMRAEVGTFATLLGLETDRLAGFTTSIKLSLKGLDDEAAQEKIQEALDTVNNELAQQVIGTWENTTYTASEYAKEGEKAIDTLRRLATSLGTVNAIWDNLGYTVYEASLRGADAASKIVDAFGGLEAMVAQFGAYIDQYYTEDEKRTNLARGAANALQSVGLSVSAEDILGASIPIVRGFVEAVLAEFGPSSPQYVAAVQQANAIAGLYESIADASDVAEKAAKDAEDALDKFADKLSAMADLLEKAANARDKAGDAMDKLAGAAGFSGDDYLKLKEQRLWASMATASYQEQIDLASELTDIVVDRYTKEVEANKVQTEFAQKLRDYVKDLRTGDLSPLTNREKLGEAQAKYETTLAQAKAGDKNAQARLQGVGAELLELGRNYYASSDGYQQIFERVTSSMLEFGNSAEQQALAEKNNSQLTYAQMEKLYYTLEKGYNQAQADVNSQTTILSQQLSMLASVNGGVERVAEIISSLSTSLGVSVRDSTIAQTAQRYVQLMNGVGISNNVSNVENDIRYASQDSLSKFYKDSGALLTSQSQMSELDAIYNAVMQHRFGETNLKPVSFTPGALNQNLASTTNGTSPESYSNTVLTESVGELMVEIKKLSNSINVSVVSAIVKSSKDNSESTVKGIGEALQEVSYRKTVQSEAVLK